tara:strand:- start:64 stop:510 length:447 start_codon:yes stop_codon:yes gene_type:complete
MKLNANKMGCCESVCKYAFELSQKENVYIHNIGCKDGFIIVNKNSRINSPIDCSIQNKECFMCLESLEGHEFPEYLCQEDKCTINSHESCIRFWYLNSARCPICMKVWKNLPKIKLPDKFIVKDDLVNNLNNHEIYKEILTSPICKRR